MFPIRETLVLNRPDNDDTRTVHSLVTPHPQQQDASIETVWELLCDEQKDPWMQRIGIYSGPDAVNRVRHVTFELPSEADPQLEEKHRTILAWATFETKETMPLSHAVLCVLVNPTQLCIWDVYPVEDELSLPAEGWTMTLPFECKSIVAVPGGGLLLQRQQYADEQQEDDDADGFVLKAPPHAAHHSPSAASSSAMEGLPSLFSLRHPLDDVLPVCEIPSGDDAPFEEARLVTSTRQNIIWLGQTSSRTLLVVTYCVSTLQHSLWRLQKAPPPPSQVPLFQRTRQWLGDTEHHKLMFMLEELDEILLDNDVQDHAHHHPSRKEALADALGVRRRSPKKALLDPPLTTHSKRPRHAHAVDSFALHSPRDSSVYHNNNITQPLHADWTWQLVHTVPASSKCATRVFLAADATSRNQVLCLACPSQKADQQEVHFWSLSEQQEPETGTTLTVSVHPTTLSCRDVQPVVCFLDQVHLLVLTTEQTLMLHRAWTPVAPCGVSLEGIQSLQDPVGNRLTLCASSRRERVQLSLHLFDETAEHMLRVMDVSVWELLQHDTTDAGRQLATILPLLVRMDACRLMASGGGAAACVQAVFKQLLSGGNAKTTITDNMTLTEQVLSMSIEEALESELDEARTAGKMLCVSALESMETSLVEKISKNLLDHLLFLHEDLKVSSAIPEMKRLSPWLMEECSLNSLSCSYPTVPSIFSWCRSMILKQEERTDWVERACQVGIYQNITSTASVFKVFFQSEHVSKFDALVETLLSLGFASEDEVRERLPACVAFLVIEVFANCRISDESQNFANWSTKTWSLVGRSDLVRNFNDEVIDPKTIQIGGGSEFDVDVNDFRDVDKDGLLPLEKESALLFPEDNRVHEAGRLLRSSRPVFLRVDRAVELSDHDYEKLKQMRLLQLIQRTLAMCVGRGMMTVGSLRPLQAEPMPIPAISLKGRIPPTNAGVSLDMNECPADMRVWPEFHNGVAASLRLPTKVDSFTSAVTRTWIVYNRPPPVQQNADDETDPANNENLFKNHSHGGFLLGLGLRGHLNALDMSDLYEYLTQGTVTTTVGVLLGMAANSAGTADLAVSKMLCLHIPSLIPQHFSAIDVASTVQAAAVIGTGLLFQGTSHRMMTEFLLNEIGKRPESDTSAFDRESYTLACGLALGMVNLSISSENHGIDRVAGIADLRIEERLQKYVLGGVDMEEHGRVRESSDRFTVPTALTNGETEKCSTIYEGELINTGVTAPGATLALGLMYMKSGNHAIASSLALPDTHFLLEFVRPDLLTLRIISKTLILWDDVEPSVDWVHTQMPSVIRKSYTKMSEMAKRAAEGFAFTPGKPVNEMKFDKRAVRQIYAHSVAGACFGMGLRFAGTANSEASAAIEYFVLRLHSLRESGDPVAMATKPELPILETCLGCAAISLALVMAGTGDLRTLKVLKMLHWRCDEVSRYGFHMMCGMAIGLLFLGGGTCSIGREPSDIAALVLAFFPRFAVNTSDNQNHLQALRHFYALAVRRRELKAVDVDTGKCVKVPFEIVFEDGSKENIMLPYLLRNYDVKPKQLCMLSPSHYPLKLNLDQVMEKKNGIVYVRRRLNRTHRPGLQPYIKSAKDETDSIQQAHPNSSNGLVSAAMDILSEVTAGETSGLSSLAEGEGAELGSNILPVILDLLGSKGEKRNENLQLLKTFCEEDLGFGDPSTRRRFVGYVLEAK